MAGLKEFRSDSKFSEIWVQVTSKAFELSIGEPTLPHKRKRPRRYDGANSTTYQDTIPDSMYKKVLL